MHGVCGVIHVLRGDLVGAGMGAGCPTQNVVKSVMVKIVNIVWVTVIV